MSWVDDWSAVSPDREGPRRPFRVCPWPPPHPMTTTVCAATGAEYIRMHTFMNASILY